MGKKKRHATSRRISKFGNLGVRSHNSEKTYRGIDMCYVPRYVFLTDLVTEDTKDVLAVLPRCLRIKVLNEYDSMCGYIRRSARVNHGHISYGMKRLDETFYYYIFNSNELKSVLGDEYCALRRLSRIASKQYKIINDGRSKNDPKIVYNLYVYENEKSFKTMIDPIFSRMSETDRKKARIIPKVVSRDDLKAGVIMRDVDYLSTALYDYAERLYYKNLLYPGTEKLACMELGISEVESNTTDSEKKNR